MRLSRISLLAPDPGRVWRDPAAKTLSFFCLKRPVRIDSAVIRELIELGTAEGSRNVRVCLHNSPQALHHDMINLEHRGRYYRPHRHTDKGECFHIMQGEMGLFAFDIAGTVIDAVRLASGEIYRVEIGMYHAVIPLSDMVIYHENKPGPFLGDGDSLYPDWAPDGRDVAEAEAYSRGLLHYLKP
jgi:glucose-6-phosphate isomerase